jgi:hypothetical protein
MDEKFSVSPVYQWTIEKGIAIGEERGKAEEIAEMLTQIRQSVLQTIFDQFPSLTRFAKEVLATFNDPVSLFTFGINLAKAQSTEEAQRILLTRQKNGKYKNTDDTLSIPSDYLTLDEDDGNNESEVTDFDRGRTEGIALGQALAKDEMLAQLQSAGKRIVFERFSSLTRITKEVLAAITDPGLLLLIVIKLAQIQSAEEAQEFLLCLHPQFVNRTQQESRALS